MAIKPGTLIMIEWEDSRKPNPAWLRLADYNKPSVVSCQSVGWLIKNGKKVKALVQNLGDVTSKNGAQVSGVIQIPARSINRIVKLKEASAVSSGL